MHKFSLINFLTKESKARMHYATKLRVFQKGQNAYVDGEKSDMIYMVKSGHFEFEK